MKKSFISSLLSLGAMSLSCLFFAEHGHCFFHRGPNKPTEIRRPDNQDDPNNALSYAFAYRNLENYEQNYTISHRGILRQSAINEFNQLEILNAINNNTEQKMEKIFELKKRNSIKTALFALIDGRSEDDDMKNRLRAFSAILTGVEIDDIRRAIAIIHDKTNILTALRQNLITQVMTQEEMQATLYKIARLEITINNIYVDIDFFDHFYLFFLSGSFYKNILPQFVDFIITNIKHDEDRRNIFDYISRHR